MYTQALTASKEEIADEKEAPEVPISSIIEIFSRVRTQKAGNTQVVSIQYNLRRKSFLKHLISYIFLGYAKIVFTHTFVHAS
jgi:hypothetical protein